MGLSGLLGDARASLLQRVAIDLGAPSSVVLLAGMGRSGTTWVAELLNAGNSFRVMQEPFHAGNVPGVSTLARRGAMHPYIPPGDHAPEALAVARRVLGGYPHCNRWVNGINRRLVARRRLIKEIRANLMLAWLAALQPRMPVVWLVRHPLAVAASWAQLGWLPPAGQLESLDSLVARFAPLFDDLPELKAGASCFDAGDPFSRALLLWYLMHRVPQVHLPAGRVFLLPYEQLRDRPDTILDPLLAHVGQADVADAARARLERPSSTDFRRRAASARTELQPWRDVITAAQERDARAALRAAGMDWYAGDEPPAGGPWSP